MKKIKNLFSMAICFVICFSLMMLNVNAAGPRDGEVVDGSLLTSDSKVEGSWRAIARGNYLASGVGSIENHGNGVIKIAGSTLCNRVCDKVVVNLYLERLVNGSWVSVDQRYHTAYNTTQASYNTSLVVATGYYYRVQGVHMAVKGSTTETSNSWSSGIWIN